MAAVSFEEDPDGQAVVAFGGDVTLERRAFLDWLSLQRELESPFLPATPPPRIAQGPDRELVLNPRLGVPGVPAPPDAGPHRGRPRRRVGRRLRS